MDKKSYVTASEVGEFIFCKRGWWLRQNGQGIVTDAMTAGTSAHNRLFTAVLMHKKKVLFGIILVMIGIFLLIALSVFGGFSR